MPAVWYAQALAGQWGTTAARRVDWVTDTITVSLHTSAYTPDQDAHDFFNDATNEVSGNGYAQQVLTGKSVAYDSTTNHVQLRAANTTFTATGAGWTHRYILVWVNTAGASSTDPLLGVVDTLGQSVPAGNYVVDWDDLEGVLTIAVP